MPHTQLSLSGKCCFCFLLFIYTIRSKAVAVEHSFPNRYQACTKNSSGRSFLQGKAEISDNY